MGEGLDNDALLIPLIDAANIACGYHAGDTDTMKQTIQLAMQYQVKVGAHVSFADRPNFGRTEMNLSGEAVYTLVQEQIYLFKNIAAECDTPVHHVKPHGALYNMSARNMELAMAIAQAVKDVDDQLVLFGLSGSYSISEAKKIGLRTANEVFADRTYQDDGSLTPRTKPNAMIFATAKAIEQVLQMKNDHTVTSITNNIVSVQADTLCIHGDGPHAVEFAQAIRAALKSTNT